MDYTKQPLADMFKLLSHEEWLLTNQIAVEQEASERLKMNQDLMNVKILLSEIASKLLVSTYAPYLRSHFQCKYPSPCVAHS